MSSYLVSSGETSSGIILNRLDSMFVYEGGTADATTVNSSGTLHVSGGTAENTTVNSRGTVRIFSGGTGKRTFVSSRGSLHISGGGLADCTTIFSGGSLNVSSGGKAVDTTVSSGGRLTVFSGGLAADATVSSGGRFAVSSGGTASGFVVSEGAYLDFTVTSDTLIAGISAGSAFEIKNGLASNYTVHSGGTLNVSSGGRTDGVMMNGGVMYVDSGGLANHTVLSRGTLYVFNEGSANNTMVSSGTFSVSDQGTAGNIAVFSGGSLGVFREGVANIASVFSEGRLTVSSGGRLNSASVFSQGRLVVFSLGLAGSAAVFSGGALKVSSGGTAVDATVFSGGSLQVFAGGIADNTTVNPDAELILESGGTASIATVRAGGTLKIESGGRITSAAIQSGGILLGYFDCRDVTFDPGSDLYFDISGTAADNPDALVNLTGLSDQDSRSYHLLISDSQETGGYRLAEGAWNFDQTISVVNQVMQLGSISLDQSFRLNGKEYTLNLVDGDLMLNVSAPPVQYVYLDFDGEDHVRYSNPDLDMTFDLSVAAPGFSEEQRTAVLAELSRRYHKDNIAFTLERPENGDYSTLYFGKSSAFGDYGEFFGVAETHDGNNRNPGDNAFILLDESYSSGQIVSTASHMLDHLLGFSYFVVDGTPALRKYAESMTLLSLSAGWVQDDPYNQYCPIDPGTEERCITGCTNNAASQIIYYWLEKGMLDLTLSLEDQDAYVCTTNITIESSENPSSGHLSFAETNKLLSAFKMEDSDSIAALCFAAGVVQKAVYSSNSTGAFWNKNLFVRAGFEPGVTDRYMTVGKWPQGAESYVNPDTRLSDDDFMVNEVLQGRPVGISLQSIGHAVVVDGYDSSRNMFHLNYGWGEDKNRWCTLEQLIELQIDEAVCGITPIVSPDLTVENLSVGEETVRQNETVTLSFAVSNAGTEVSAETFAYIYCGDLLLGSCGLSYISPGYSRELTCTVVTASLPFGENVLTVKVGSQKDDGTVSAASVTMIHAPASDVAPQTLIWEETADASQYVVECSTDNFGHVIRFAVDTHALDSFQLPAGSYQWRVKGANRDDWTVGEPLEAAGSDPEPKLVRSNVNGNADMFFVNAVGTWEPGYVAQHVGSINDWAGTNEYAAILGRNKLSDIIEGSADANVLLLTDDSNGDALFVDDIYSDSPDELGLSQSRIARMDEIRAGAGDDVVDMTSQRFEYVGDGLTIRGGSGSDSIWANKGDNKLFGDAGNDRLIGASGNDILVGGSGNDRMHGGGGSDIFAFDSNWGQDIVEQLASGDLTLWFAAGSEDNWNLSTLTYTDGNNTVAVSGVSADKVTLKFGDDGTETYAALAAYGAFEDYTSEKIFEDRNKGMLATL